MSQKRVSVAVDDRFMDRFREVVRRARAAGLVVDQELEDAGVILGSIDEGKLGDLEHVEGVAAAEPSRDIQIAPPDSQIQ